MTAGPARRPVSTARHRNQKRPGLRCSPRRPADGRRRVPSRSCTRRGTMGSNRRQRDARDRCGAEPRRHRDAGPPPSACPPQAPSWFPLIPRGSSVDDDRTSEPSSARLRSRDGVAANPLQGEALSLRPCTVAGRTVWIVGTALSPSTAPAGFFPIVSGATRDFSRPFAMSYPRHVNTSDKTLPPIRLRHLRFHGSKRTLLENQLGASAADPSSAPSSRAFRRSDRPE
jgi:hypothetical protein